MGSASGTIRCISCDKNLISCDKKRVSCDKNHISAGNNHISCDKNCIRYLTPEGASVIVYSIDVVIKTM